MVPSLLHDLLITSPNLPPKKNIWSGYLVLVLSEIRNYILHVCPMLGIALSCIPSTIYILKLVLFRDEMCTVAHSLSGISVWKVHTRKHEPADQFPMHMVAKNQPICMCRGGNMWCKASGENKATTGKQDAVRTGPHSLALLSWACIQNKETTWRLILWR